MAQLPHVSAACGGGRKSLGRMPQRHIEPHATAAWGRSRKDVFLTNVVFRGHEVPKPPNRVQIQLELAQNGRVKTCHDLYKEPGGKHQFDAFLIGSS